MKLQLVLMMLSVLMPIIHAQEDSEFNFLDDEFQVLYGREFDGIESYEKNSYEREYDVLNEDSDDSWDEDSWDDDSSDDSISAILIVGIIAACIVALMGVLLVRKYNTESSDDKNRSVLASTPRESVLNL